MNKKNIKIIIIVLLIGVIYIGLFAFFFKDDKQDEKTSNKGNVNSSSVTKKKNNKELYIILKNHNIKKINNKNYTDIDNDLIYTKYTYDLYDEGNYVGKFTSLYNNDQEYFFDKNKNKYTPTGDFMAFYGNIDYEVKKIVKSNDLSLSDIEIVNKVLTENDIQTGGYNQNNLKITTDIDNDGVDENIYKIDNIFKLNIEQESKSYAFIFMQKNDEIVYFYKYVDSIDQNISTCSPYISGIVDINKDNKNEIFVGCSYYSYIGTCYYVYQYGDKITEISSCNLKK